MKVNSESIKDNITKISDEIISISQYLHKNPETGFKEYKACKLLTDYLKSKGFTVTKYAAGLETAFIAEYSGDKKGPVIAFVAEYDALPEIGHACGHNIIASSAVGAGIVSKQIVDEFGGTVKVIGTPAEELMTVKQQMIDAGVFDNVDAAILMHPTEKSIYDDISFASTNIEYKFLGKAAHSAAFPWKGKNALSAVIEMFNSTNSLRMHLKDYTRVNGIITKGGIVPNIIPEKAVAVFNFRALNMPTLNNLIDKVNQCAKGSALVTDTKVSINPTNVITKDIRNNKTIVSLIKKNMDLIGENNHARTLDQGIGSTDMGNLTHAIPAVQAYIGMGGIGTHTTEFAEASGSHSGNRAVINAAEIMALTALDILSDKNTLQEIKREFAKSEEKDNA